MENPRNAQTDPLQAIIDQQAAEINRLEVQLQQEVAKRQRAEARVRVRDRFYHTILGMMHEFAFSYSVEDDGSITRQWMTGYFEQILGYSDKEVDALGGLRALVHPDDTPYVQQVLAEVISGKEVVSELRFITRGGDERWIRSINRPLWDPTRQRVTRIYGAAKDVTEERAIHDQQARFITNAMHELAHPVSSLLMRLYLMRKQPERLEEHLDALEPVANHMRHLVEDMREISYLERGLITLDQRPLLLQDIMPLIVRSREQRAANRHVQLELSIPEAPLSILADSERFQQAICNLLNNAINQTGPQDSIAIRVWPDAQENPARAVIQITHQARNHQDDHPSLIFSPFHRPSEGDATHTGLELAIAREIIALHGGKIDVNLDSDQQRTFLLHFTLTHNH